MQIVVVQQVAWMCQGPHNCAGILTHVPIGLVKGCLLDGTLAFPFPFTISFFFQGTTSTPSSEDELKLPPSSDDVELS